ncbi:MAG: hypothetical protein EA398_16640 [Deltaproteobacteria bacterium]|nr:MAG: hypothetical protein EA398_16640 [Deltaproteobacteria bacterium]
MPVPASPLVKRYVHLCFERPLLLLVAVLVPTIALGVMGASIGLDTDLRDLLPEDAPAVIAMEEASQRRGGADMFAIAVTSPDPIANVRFVDALAEALADWEEVEFFELSHDQAFFREHALLFLPPEDLRRVRETLGRMIRNRLAAANPLYVDLDTAEERAEMDAFDFRDPTAWVDPLTLRELGFDEGDYGTLFPFLDRDDEDGTLTEESGLVRRPDGRVRLPDPWRDYRVSPDGSVALLQAKLLGSGTDLTYAREAFERGEAAIDALDPAGFHPELRAEVVGAYRGHLEVAAVARDVRTATSLSIGLVLLFLIVFFRNGRAVFIVLTPLLLGVVWTLGLLDLLFGRLNILTAFVFAMLIGMGIDFAIHLYRRIQEEAGAGHSKQDACVIALVRTGRALLTTAMTTVVALLTLTLASFDGFREFGIACAAGVAMCYASTVLIVPLLTGLTEWLRPAPVASHAATAPVDAGAGAPLLKGLAIAVTVLVVASLAAAPNVEFEYDFDNLSGPGSGRTISYGAAVGAQRGTAPNVLVGRDEAQMRAAHQVLRQRLRDGDPLLRSFVTIESFLPSGQDERMELIDDIADTLDRRAVQRIDGDEGRIIAELTRLSHVEPFGLEQVPEWATSQIRERDGAIGGLGLLHGDFARSDVREIVGFREHFALIPTDEGDVRVSSGSFILADVVDFVQADGRILPLYVALALFLVLLIDLRRPLGALICLGALAAAAALTTGLMVLFGVRIGLYNMVVLPMILGVGVDGAVHIYHRYLEEGRDQMVRVLRSTGMAVLASGLTTGAGFFGLVVVSHQGVVSIGMLALFGIFSSMVAVLALMPGLLMVFGRQRGPGMVAVAAPEGGEGG